MKDNSERLLELLKSKISVNKKVGVVITGKSKLTFDNKQVDCLYFMEIDKGEKIAISGMTRFQIYGEEEVVERHFPWTDHEVTPFSKEEFEEVEKSGMVKIEYPTPENGILSVLRSDEYIQELDACYLHINEAHPIDLFFNKPIMMG